MGHYHSHSHDHDAHSPHTSNLSFAIAVILNLVYTMAQVIYALLANSMGLLADAGHNFGDVLGLGLAWGANWLLTLPGRKRYSYGYKRTTILAAISNSLMLVAASAVIAYASIYRLFNPEPINTKLVLIVALIGIIINGGTSLLFLKGSHSDLNIKGAYYHLLSDALVSLGVVISALMIMWTGQVWIDPVVGLIIVAIILWAAWGLLRDSLSLILDAVPHYIDQVGIKEYLSQLPGVTSVHDLHIWSLSTREVALTAHCVIPNGNLSAADYQRINKTLRERFKVHHVTIQVETGSTDHPCDVSERC